MSPPYSFAPLIHKLSERPNDQDRAYAARCFQELSRCQGITQSLRHALRHEHRTGMRRRLKYLLRRSVMKERAALQMYRQALMAASKAIVARHYPGFTPPDHI